VNAISVIAAMAAITMWYERAAHSDVAGHGCGHLSW
jgi:hypothetical protein